MKRSEALAILSRDHHQALFVAHTLSRADDTTSAAARTRFREYWVGHGRRHFRVEEEVLLPAYAVYGDPHHPLVLRVLGDHVAIRAKVACLGRRPSAGVVALRELGTALCDHVRLEERELFPVIEDAMPPEELFTLAQALERVEGDEYLRSIADLDLGG